MSGRGAMTHRCTIQRNTEAGTDEWNNPAAPVFTSHLTNVACRAWTTQKKHVRDDGKEAVIEDIRAIFTSSTDIRAGDRLPFINDRNGNTRIVGPLAVQTVVRRGAQQKEVMLTRHM